MTVGKPGLGKNPIHTRGDKSLNNDSKRRSAIISANLLSYTLLQTYDLKFTGSFKVFFCKCKK